MKKIIFLILCLSQCLKGFAQDQHVIDSLKEVIARIEKECPEPCPQDTNRIAAYIKLGEQLILSDPDSTLKVEMLAKNIAENLINSKLPTPVVNTTKRYLATILNNIGYICYSKGDISTAVDYFHESLNLFKVTGEMIGVTDAYNNIGVIYLMQSDFPKALKYIHKSLEIREEIGYGKGIAYSFNCLGYIYQQQGDIPEALEYFQKSQDICQKIGDKQGISTAYNNIGDIYEKQGNIFKALEYNNLSLNICIEIGDKKRIASCYNGIGYMYDKQGDIENALKYYIKSYEINKEIAYKQGLALSYNNIGVTYHKMGELTTALEYHHRSIKIKEEINDKRGIANSYNNIGVIYRDQNDINKAIKYYSNGFNIYKEIGNKMGMTTSLYNLGRIYQKKNDDLQFKKYTNELYTLGKELGMPEIIKKASLLMKDYCIEHNMYESADSCAIEVNDIDNKAVLSNFSTLSEAGQERYFKKVSEDYMEFNSYALLRKQDNPEILNYVYNNTIKNKGLLLKSSTAMRNAVMGSGDSLLIANYYQWILLKKKIAKLYSKGEDTEVLDNQTNELEKALVKGSQLFSDFKKVQNISWKDVQNGLKPNEAAIEFVHFKYKNYNSEDFTEFSDSTLYCALIIKPESKHPEMIPLFEEKQLEEILGKYPGNNHSYIRRIYGNNDEPKTELYNLIWKPMEENLEGVKTLYLSPTGLLHKVSFSAIAKEQNVYLCDMYEIQMQSSTGKIVMPESFVLDNELTATLFGGIDYNSDSTIVPLWPYLEGTKAEAENIKELLIKKGVYVHYFTDNSATENEFKVIASKSDVLHISTHGFFYPDPKQMDEELEKTVEYGKITFRGDDRGFGVGNFVKNPNPLMRSGLALAGANDVWNRKNRSDGEDGVLTAMEVSHIDMRNTELAVMSACETGLGDIKGSEGVYGLQRAFKMAGVKFIVMSLWQVPDRETQEFMTTFYTKLFDLKNIRTAFSATQKEMREKYDPFFWAAFVLIE